LTTARQISNDDWGDFQDFQSPTETSKPLVVDARPQTTIAEDDDFADFVTATCPQPVNPAQHQHVNPQGIIPVQSYPSPAFGVTSVATNPGPSQGANPLSNSVGLRLASFQEESPVHNFRVNAGSKFEPPRLSVSESPSRFEAFFGGTDDDSFRIESGAGAAATTSAEIFPSHPIISTFPAFDTNISNVEAPLTSSTTPAPKTLPTFDSGMSVTMSTLGSGSSLPTPIPPSNDKYSALADLLSLSDNDVSSFSTLQAAPFPGTGSTSGIEEIRPVQTFQTSLITGSYPDSNPPVFQINFNLPPKSENGEEEDFGDFIAGPTNPGKPIVSETAFSAFTPSRSNVPVMTWHESRLSHLIFWRNFDY